MGERPGEGSRLPAEPAAQTSAAPHRRQLNPEPFGKDRRGKPVRTTRPSADGATHGPPRTEGLSVAARSFFSPRTRNQQPHHIPMNQTTNIQSASLHYREGASDKVYHAAIEPKADGFVVSYAYGRRGTTLTTGTKTDLPVPLETATTLFNKLVASKLAKGYQRDGEAIQPYALTGNEGADTGIRCQLLNPVDESRLPELLGDNRHWLQEKHDGTWSLPAGAIEPGESPAEAVAREVLEETGLTCISSEVIAVLGGGDFRFTY
ncbi:MAG: NUDIX domain-containing protein, partial [Verrucomicrobiaceae bacterium]